MKPFSGCEFAIQFEAFTDGFGRPLTWHDSCTFVLADSLRDRFEPSKEQLCHTAASIRQPEKYSRPFLSIPMSRCGARWPARTKHFGPGRRVRSVNARRSLAGQLRYFSKRMKNSLASPHWKWERESPRAEAKWN